jgi:tetratricopeptide (TPR) repeat protein
MYFFLRIVGIAKQNAKFSLVEIMIQIFSKFKNVFNYWQNWCGRVPRCTFGSATIRFQRIRSNCSTSCLSAFQRSICKSSTMFSLIMLPIIKLKDTVRSLTDSEIQEKILVMLHEAEAAYREENFVTSQTILQNILKLMEQSNSYSSLAYVYEMLVAIAFRLNDFLEAERMIVEFVEKLQLMKYPEDHNTIVQFHLVLARLYAVQENRKMAEIGFQNCIATLKRKMKVENNLEASSNVIYISCLFWYANFLSDNGELEKAKAMYLEALHHLVYPHHITSQQMTVMFYNASEMHFKLHEYDDAIYCMINAIGILQDMEVKTRDYPVYLVKLGVLFMHKKMYEKAKFWCESGRMFAHHYDSVRGEQAAASCLEELMRAQAAASAAK